MEKYKDEKSKIIRESIGEAILTILRTKKFDEISICDICKKAGVGRTTFYRYYGNKGGKENAIYYWLVNRWEAHIDYQVLSLEDLDNAFLAYVFSIKPEILLLRNNSLIHILDSFILSVYGPKESNMENVGLYYVQYAGAGMWMGIIRAIISRNFIDSETAVKKQFQNALTLMAIENAQ